MRNALRAGIAALGTLSGAHAYAQSFGGGVVNRPQQSSFFDNSSTSVAASAVLNGTVRATYNYYSRFNVAAYASVAGTIVVQGCPDATCSVPMTLMTQAMTAATYYTLPAVALPTPYVRFVYTSGSTAGTVTVQTSLTAN